MSILNFTDLFWKEKNPGVLDELVRVMKELDPERAFDRLYKSLDRENEEAVYKFVNALYGLKSRKALNVLPGFLKYPSKKIKIRDN